MQDPFDMAAFERAFDAAHKEAMEVEEEAARAIRELQEETTRLSAQEASTMEQEILLERSILEDIAMDEEAQRSLDQEQQKPEQKSEDDDDLSRVAGELLDSVSHDNSQKFQDSVFLQLMRKLRDKEVKVDAEGENFVEVST